VTASVSAPTKKGNSGNNAPTAKEASEVTAAIQGGGRFSGRYRTLAGVHPQRRPRIPGDSCCCLVRQVGVHAITHEDLSELLMLGLRELGQLVAFNRRLGMGQLVWLRTEMYSPATMDMLPATIPASPASRMVLGFAPPPPTPRMSDALLTRPVHGPEHRGAQPAAGDVTMAVFPSLGRAGRKMPIGILRVGHDQPCTPARPAQRNRGLYRAIGGAGALGVDSYLPPLVLSRELATSHNASLARSAASSWSSSASCTSHSSNRLSLNFASAVELLS